MHAMANWQQPVRGLSQVAAEPSCLSVCGLTKSYGSVLALDNFSLDFAAGQCTVLLGPSGCGKTTVLRSIAGLISPDAGRINIDNSAVFDADAGTNVPPEKRRLGMVFQSYALWPHLSVAQNIAYPLISAGLSKGEIASRTDAMLEWIGLAGLGGRYAHELSGGQQQRVSLGRAIDRQAACHPVRRAVVEPGRPLARTHAVQSCSRCGSRRRSHRSTLRTISWRR